MAENPMSDRAREFHAAIEKSCVPRIDRATAPIIAVQNDKIIHNRSGVLYRIGDEHFVLTAAHDIREIVENNIGLYVSVNHPSVMPIPLADAKFHSTEVEGRDLAAIWIPPEVASEVAKHKDFLLHNQINQHPDPNRAMLLFYGYPGEWAGHTITETGIVSQALAFSTFEDYLDPKDFRDYDPKLHMLLNYTRDGIESRTGSKDRLPPLNGVSGCGIWQVGDKDGKNAVPRTVDTLTLVAIEHAVYINQNRVKATKIAYALELIAENFPATRKAMSLEYPVRPR